MAMRIAPAWFSWSFAGMSDRNESASLRYVSSEPCASVAVISNAAAAIARMMYLFMYFIRKF